MRLTRGLGAVSAAFGVLLAFSTGCGEGTIRVNVDHRYEEVRARLLEKHLVNGVVVSLGSPGHAPNNRDALLHTSLTLAALPCSDAPRILLGIASLEIEPGRYIRYYDSPKSDQISRDMIVGLVFGMAEKYRECPKLRPELRGRMGRLLRFIDSHNDSLGVGPAAKLTGASRAGVYFAAEIMGLHQGPSPGDRAVLASQAVLLPATVLSSGFQFYAVHLTALELLLWTWAEPLSPELKPAQSAFCRITGSFENALYDGVCGRTDSVEKALREWDYNCEVYRWQVSDPWSTCQPGGIEHPGHDFLLLYQLYVRSGEEESFLPNLRADQSAGKRLKQFEEVLLPYR